MNIQLCEVQHFLQSNGILISFSGKLTQGLIEEYGAAVKKYLEQAERPTSEIHNVFSIFIEQTQNIKNYCSSKDNSPHGEQIASSSVVTIGKEELQHVIRSGNLVENADVVLLREALDQIVALDRTELKQLYKAKLREAVDQDALGAGIGLVEMARKAKRPLEYSITPIDEHLSFFTLKAVI